MEPLLGAYKPGWHSMQELMPLAPWAEPGAHATHVEVVLLKGLPAAQGAQ